MKNFIIVYLLSLSFSLLISCGKDEPVAATQTKVDAPQISLRVLSTSIVSGGTLDLGKAFPQTSDSNTVVKRVIIENKGNKNLTLTGVPRISLSGTHPHMFSIEETEPEAYLVTNYIVAPNTARTFYIVFRPTAFGEKTATISIPNDASDGGVFTFTVKATAVKRTKDMYYTGVNLTSYTEYSYDGNSNLTLKEVKSNTNVPMNKVVYEYSSDILSKSSEYSYSGTYKLNGYVYEYNAAGKKTKSSSYTGGSLNNYTTYEFDSNGFKIKESDYSNTSVLKRYKTFEYDVHGNLSKMINTDVLVPASSGSLVYEYDPASGWMTKLTSYNNVNAVSSSATFAIDTVNKTVKIVHYDGSSVQTSAENFEIEPVFFNVTKFTSLDASNQPDTEHVYEHNSDGSIIKDSYVDYATPANSFSYMYEYNSDKLISKYSKYDNSNNLSYYYLYSYNADAVIKLKEKYTSAGVLDYFYNYTY